MYMLYQLGTFDTNAPVAKYRSFGIVNVICTFANNSQALGCLVVLHPWNTTQTEIFAYGARECISAPTANVTIHGVPRGNYTVLVFDGEYNGLLSEQAAIVPQNITVTDGDLEPVRGNAKFYALLSISHHVSRTFHLVFMQKLHAQAICFCNCTICWDLINK